MSRTGFRQETRTLKAVRKNREILCLSMVVAKNRGANASSHNGRGSNEAPILLMRRVAKGRSAFALLLGRSICTSRAKLAFALMRQRCTNKMNEKRMPANGDGLKFGVELTAHKPRVVRQFNHFHQPSIRRNTANNQAVRF